MLPFLKLKEDCYLLFDYFPDHVVRNPQNLEKPAMNKTFFHETLQATVQPLPLHTALLVDKFNIDKARILFSTRAKPRPAIRTHVKIILPLFLSHLLPPLFF